MSQRDSEITRLGLMSDSERQAEVPRDSEEELRKETPAQDGAEGEDMDDLFGDESDNNICLLYTSRCV